MSNSVIDNFNSCNMLHDKACLQLLVSMVNEYVVRSEVLTVLLPGMWHCHWVSSS